MANISEQRIASMMKNLDCSREEAVETILADIEIDKMTMKELNATISKEDKQVIKEMTKTGTRKQTVYKFDNKEKKKDTEKVEIVNTIYEFCKTFVKNAEIKNEGREITFNFGENSEYSLVLTKHRAKK